jgi:hypothetical protein
MGISTAPAQPLWSDGTGDGSGGQGLTRPQRALALAGLGLPATSPHGGGPDALRPAAPAQGGTVRGASFAHVLQSARRPASGMAPPVGPRPPGPPTPHASSPATAHSSSRSSIDQEEDDEVLQPSFRYARHAAQLAPPLTVFSQVPPATLPAMPEGTRGSLGATSLASLEDLLPALVRKIAWSGDARRGSVRIELGAGALSGATLLVHADGGQVRVALQAPPGADLIGWRARITERLKAKGLDVSEVDVE